MAICQTCQAENKDGAKWCRKCGMALTAALPLQTAPVVGGNSPPVSSPIPTELRGKVERLMNRTIGGGESAAEVLTELVSRAEVWAGQAGVLENVPLRTHLEQALERPVRPDEPVNTLIEELVGRLRAIPLVSRVEPGGAVPDPHVESNDARSRQEALKSTIQSELHAEVERLLARKIQAGEQAPQVLTELAGKLQPIVKMFGGVQFPAFLANGLSKLPQNFQWLTAVLVPLVLGAGSGFMIPSSYKKQFVQAQDELRLVQGKQSKLDIDLAAQATEIADLNKDNERLRKSISQMGTLDGQLEQSGRKTLELENNLATARATASSLRPFSERGFIRWQGEGGGNLQFSPAPTRAGNLDPGKITEGRFPDKFAGSNCVVVEIIGDIKKPEAFRDRPCSQLIQISGSQKDRGLKQALVVWRADSGK